MPPFSDEFTRGRMMAEQPRDTEPNPADVLPRLSGRLNSQLEAQGAEFLVLGHLLIDGIVCHKTYTNIPGYDLVASMPDQNTSARIQVKSRWATDFDGGFPIKNFECDFVVFVALNRGYRQKRRRSADDPERGRGSPVFYVFPVALVRAAQNPNSSWGKTFIRHIPDFGSYVNRWDLIRNFLNEPNATALR